MRRSSNKIPANPRIILTTILLISNYIVYALARPQYDNPSILPENQTTSKPVKISGDVHPEKAEENHVSRLNGGGTPSPSNNNEIHPGRTGRPLASVQIESSEGTPSNAQASKNSGKELQPPTSQEHGSGLLNPPTDYATGALPGGSSPAPTPSAEEQQKMAREHGGQFLKKSSLSSNGAEDSYASPANVPKSLVVEAQSPPQLKHTGTNGESSTKKINKEKAPANELIDFPPIGKQPTGNLRNSPSETLKAGYEGPAEGLSTDTPLAVKHPAAETPTASRTLKHNTANNEVQGNAAALPKESKSENNEAALDQSITNAPTENIAKPSAASGTLPPSMEPSAPAISTSESETPQQTLLDLDHMNNASSPAHVALKSSSGQSNNPEAVASVSSTQSQDDKNPAIQGSAQPNAYESGSELTASSTSEKSQPLSSVIEHPSEIQSTTQKYWTFSVTSAKAEDTTVSAALVDQTEKGVQEAMQDLSQAGDATPTVKANSPTSGGIIPSSIEAQSPLVVFNRVDSKSNEAKLSPSGGSTSSSQQQPFSYESVPSSETQNLIHNNNEDKSSAGAGEKSGEAPKASIAAVVTPDQKQEQRPIANGVYEETGLIHEKPSESQKQSADQTTVQLQQPGSIQPAEELQPAVLETTKSSSKNVPHQPQQSSPTQPSEESKVNPDMSQDSNDTVSVAPQTTTTLSQVTTTSPSPIIDEQKQKGLGGYGEADTGSRPAVQPSLPSNVVPSGEQNSKPSTEAQSPATGHAVPKVNQPRENEEPTTGEISIATTTEQTTTAIILETDQKLQPSAEVEAPELPANDRYALPKSNQTTQNEQIGAVAVASASVTEATTTIVPAEATTESSHQSNINQFAEETSSNTLTTVQEAATDVTKGRPGDINKLETASNITTPAEQPQEEVMGEMGLKPQPEVYGGAESLTTKLTSSATSIHENQNGDGAVTLDSAQTTASSQEQETTTPVVIINETKSEEKPAQSASASTNTLVDSSAPSSDVRESVQATPDAQPGYGPQQEKQDVESQTVASAAPIENTASPALITLESTANEAFPTEKSPESSIIPEAEQLTTEPAAISGISSEIVPLLEGSQAPDVTTVSPEGPKVATVSSISAQNATKTPNRRWKIDQGSEYEAPVSAPLEQGTNVPSEAAIEPQGSQPAIKPSEAVGYDGIPPVSDQNQVTSADVQHDVVVSSANKDSLLSSLPVKRTDSNNMRKSKWRPFEMNCSAEVDERGPELCQEWAKGGLCESHRATMFLFCRKTCLCIGPQLESLGETMTISSGGETDESGANQQQFVRRKRRRHSTNNRFERLRRVRL